MSREAWVSLVSIGVLLGGAAAGVAAAESPRLLFERSGIDGLRRKTAQPALAPVWAKMPYWPPSALKPKF